MNRKWNPRYVTFAKAHGRTPAAQLKHDKAEGPSMLPFILWIGRARSAFQKKHPEAFAGTSTLDGIMDYDAWDAFLLTFPALPKDTTP